MEDSNVKVAVRCRPMSSKETARMCKCVISMPSSSSIHVEKVGDMTEGKDFAFDHCYFIDSTQEQVYADLGKPLLEKALDGFNGTIFAYG